ncbi:hypothetical protein EJB05_02277 [Eragrostis curvula]|uniref:Uncharacterized protein n=1 Tax=Eragrostis curvula TaxID=38414 RepID=A0A5J9WQ49_9POAL|nr:hypothetical protein EJB05_02277 [Eragrostis curvula]
MDAAALSRVALQAAADGNLRLLKKAAKQVDLRGATNADGWNALHVASAKGRVDICRFLIEDEEGPGIDVNSRSAAEGTVVALHPTLYAAGDTPVFIAATEGHLPVLRYLLDHGGDPSIPNARGITPLHRAAKNGLLHLSSSSAGLISPCDAVRLLLSKGVPLEPLANGWTPLHFAINGAQFQALRVLLEHGADAGADVNSMTPYGQTALTHAVDCCLPGFQKLKEVGADPNYPGEEVLDDSLGDIIEFLLEAGADPNIPNEYGKIPIMAAAAWGPRKLVEILFSWTKPIPSLPDWNVDAIIRAMKLKAKGTVSVDLEVGLCTAKSKGKEAFGNGDYLAASFFYGVAITLDPLDATLFANRSVSYLRLGEGNSAFMDAARCRIMRPRWAKAWYREGAALSLLKIYTEAVDAFKEALKLDPASGGHGSCRKLLETGPLSSCCIQLGSSYALTVSFFWDQLEISYRATDGTVCFVCESTPNPQPPAMDAAALSRVALQAAADGNLRLLKKAAKQVDLRGATNADGWNALHVASAKGRVDICRFLIEDEEGPGIDVNSRSAEGAVVSLHPTLFAAGDTPVFIAATEGHLPVLRYLLDRGGDPAMPNARGITPLHRAAMNGLLHLSSHLIIISWVNKFDSRVGPCDAVRLLLSKGVPVEPLANRWTPLHFAILGKQFQALGVLLDHGADAGADVNSMTPYGQTALTHAIGCCLPSFDKLKEVGADPNYPGEEVLDDSLGDIVKFLLEAGADPNIPNEYGKIPIMVVAAWGPRKLVEILFSWTKPIPSLPDWNVDAIIRAMKLKAKGTVSVELEEYLCTSKSKGKEAFGNGDYCAATFFYGQAISIDPLDATLFANRSVSHLRTGDGNSALMDALKCRMMRPRWAKAWYREGAALSLLKGGQGSYGKQLETGPLSSCFIQLGSSYALTLLCTEDTNVLHTV